jgi:predicted dienelactone hydrolase
MNRILAAALALGLSTPFAINQAMPQDNRIDAVRPDAPELAPYGAAEIGVRTIDLVNKDQIDIVKVEAGKDHPRYDRPLKVEVWYPAELSPSAQPRTYEGVILRDGETKVTLYGKALRDAEPKAAENPYPLVIISHGYPGNRFLLSHLAENLASKGYVVASIDHKDSTYDDQGKFGSTLVNRPLDQKFVLNEIERLAAEDDNFLKGIVDADKAAIVGYSMGGYGAVISAGAGVTETAVGYEWGAPDKTLAVNQAGSETHNALPDERVKAIVAFAPWGMERGFWDEDGLAKIQKPIFYVAGSVDDVSGYENGVKKIYEGTINADTYLLTFENANHNAAAPMPAPAESWAKSEKLGWAPFDHYADPVWDTIRMNNIAQHFVTAFLGKYLKEDEAMEAYLDVVPEAANGVYAANEDGTFKPEHTYWKGFPDRTAKGLTLSHRMAGSN